jgi:hypothetical protein
LATPARRSQAGVWQPFKVTASDRGGGDNRANQLARDEQAPLEA